MEEQSQNGRFFIVVGTPSSGTSCVARVLHALGIDMGDIGWEKQFPERPRQYEHYECTKFRAICRRRVIAATEINRYIEARLSKGGMHGAKFPHFLRIVPTGLHREIKAEYIVVDRPIQENIRSQKSYKEGKPGMVEERIKRLCGWKETLAIDCPPIMRVSYPDLVSDPEAAINKMTFRLGIIVTNNTLARAYEAVDSSMRHQK